MVFFSVWDFLNGDPYDIYLKVTSIDRVDGPVWSEEKSTSLRSSTGFDWVSYQPISPLTLIENLNRF